MVFETIVPAQPLPEVQIPSSSSTVKVSIIDSTTTIGLPWRHLIQPAVEGITNFVCPAYSFLVEHPSSGSKILYDLAVRKDWENYAPPLAKRIVDGNWQCDVDFNVSEILVNNGVKLESVNAIIWSHHHFDHIGDPSTFPSSTALIVGPGFKNKFTPGYPTNPESSLLDSDWQGREFREVDFNETPLDIGPFRAIDYFGDGSFYLLDAPGHTSGHIAGLARIQDGSGQQSFVLMGGDAAHHGGEMRPNLYTPLPKQLNPNPLQQGRSSIAGLAICPGEIFLDQGLLDGAGEPRSANNPFLVPSPAMAANQEDVSKTIHSLEIFDAMDDVLVAIAHDSTLKEDLDFFPKSIENWRTNGMKQRNRWRWLRDFDGELKA